MAGKGRDGFTAQGVEKNKCETAGVVFLEQYRWRKAGQALRQKLGEFTDEPIFSGDISSARQLYFDGLHSGMVNENEEMMMERYFEWFIFDYVTKSGLTPIEIYARKSSVSALEKKLLDDWTGSRLSLFEVCSVDRCGLKIKDLILERELQVNNFNVAGKMDRGSVIYMRVLKVGEEFEFSTGGFGLPPECSGPLLEKVRAGADQFAGKRRGHLFMDKYLRDRSYIINKWVLDFARRTGESDAGPDSDREGILPGIKDLSDRLSLKIAQQITDAFLDDYYERWIDQPIEALNGKTPSESCKTVHGRTKVEELLKELEKMERSRVRKGEPHYDINKVRSRLGLNKKDSAARAEKGRNLISSRQPDWENFNWENDTHSKIAFLIAENLRSKNYSAGQIMGAVKLWFDYCAKEHPRVRKEGLWIAAVIYALARIEFETAVSQQKLADEFGINVSGLSEKFRLLCRSLDLTVFDKRYTAGKSPIEDLELSDPLLAKLLYNLKL